MIIAPGNQLKHYEICSVLGAGGMGEVYLAQDLRLKRRVAIKILPPKISRNPQARQRFLQEARAASALSHPNIAHIYEVNKADHLNFIAMEYVDGQMLREYLTLAPRALREVLDITVQIASALAAAHAAGIIHRDVKPENIMVRPDGYIKMLDFGLATYIEQPPQTIASEAPTIGTVKTQPGMVLGTISHMSPEQARGHEVDARTDVWSLGVVFYEMLAGRLPFTGGSPNDVIAAILEHDPPPIARFVSNLPEGVEWVVMKALVKDREQRYQSIKEFMVDIQRLKSRVEGETELERSDSTRLLNGLTMAKSLRGTAPGVQGTDPQSQYAMSNAEYIVTGIRHHKWASLLVVLLLSAFAVGIVAFIMRGRAQSSGQLMLTRLTFDSGLQSNPTWSPDGRFIAYDSDRGGNFDVWVQPISGGDPFRVTQSPAHDWQPDWSPDGTKIVFRSERDGGGLFVVSAFGGHERKISSFGYRAKWSPDGSKILFLSPGTRIFDYPRVFLMNVDGAAAPVEILNSIAGDLQPVKKGYVAWYPDSKHVSFIADGGAFWTVPISGGPPLKSEVDDKVTRGIATAGVDFGNFRWSPGGDAMYLEGTSRGVKNLWKIEIEPRSRRWVNGPSRLTTGFSYDTDIALSPDGTKLAYSDQLESTRAWLFPFDAQTGQIKGDGQPITDSQRNSWFFDLASDGQKMVFSEQLHGHDRQALWEKSLENGQSRLLLQDDALRYFPRWSPDSRWIAYSLFRRPAPDAKLGPKGPIVLLDPNSGQERLLTSSDSSADYIYDWSPDGQWVLASTNRQSSNRWALVLFPLSAAPRAESAMRILASDPEANLWTPRFSPDGRWVCYLAQSDSKPGVSVLYVISIDGGPPVRITEEESWADKPRWSPDGKTIYFISNRGSSFLNVWGVRIDPSSGRATKEPFRVTNFARPGQFLSTQLSYAEMALSKSRLVLPVTEVSGSIWVLDNVGPASSRPANQSQYQY